MKTSDLRTKEVADLQAELHGLLQEKFNLRMQKGLGGALKGDALKKVRRNVARIKTILKEKTREVA